MGGPQALLETPRAELRELGLGADLLGALSSIEPAVEDAAAFIDYQSLGTFEFLVDKHKHTNILYVACQYQGRYIV